MTLPNQLSLLRIVLTPFFAYFLLSSEHYAIYLATFIFVIAALTDWYDGYAARRLKRITNWGKFLDPLADKILISTAFFVFWGLDFIKLWMVIAMLSRDIVITLLRLYTIEKRKPVITSNLAKWKTFSQMIYIYAGLVFINMKTIFFFDYQSISPYLYKAGFFVTMFTLFTGIIYLLENRGHIWGLISRFYRVFIPSDL